MRITWSLHTLSAVAALSVFAGCNKHEPIAKPAALGEHPPTAAIASAALANAAVIPSKPPQPEITRVEVPTTTVATQPAVLIDEAVVIAPSAPASASPKGVVLITRTGELRVAPLGPLSTKSSATTSPLKPITDASASFTFSRSPSVDGEFAYWISGHRLVRQAFTIAGTRGALEVLATDAQPAGRVALPVGAQSATTSVPPCAAYLAQNPEDPTHIIAKLWTPHANPLTLTEPGAAASSVALEQTPSGLLAWSLEGRTGMTPVHTRAIQFDGDTPQLSADHVVWVGGPSQSFTEIVPVAFPHSEPNALIAMDQDATSFGLLRLTLPPAAHEAESHWDLYANGIDPAPLATTQLCGTPVLVRAVPKSRQVPSEQQLELSSTEASSKWPTVALQTAGRFLAVSLVALPGGALLVAVTDQQTWATTLRCRRR